MIQNEYGCRDSVALAETPDCEYDREPFPEKVSLAMAYVPYQRFDDIYDDDKALERGTLFKALDLPFAGGKKR